MFHDAKLRRRKVFDLPNGSWFYIGNAKHKLSIRNVYKSGARWTRSVIKSMCVFAFWSHNFLSFFFSLCFCVVSDFFCLVLSSHVCFATLFVFLRFTLVNSIANVYMSLLKYTRRISCGSIPNLEKMLCKKFDCGKNRKTVWEKNGKKCFFMCFVLILR